MISINVIKEKYNSISVPVRASIWFMFCNIINAGLTVLSTPIFTRLMSQEEFGYYNTFYSWRMVLMILTSLNLSYGVFNNAMVKHPDSKDRDEYVSSMQGLYTIITACYFIVYFVFREWFNQILGMSTEIVVLLFIDMLLYPAFLFWQSRQRYEYKYRFLVIVTIISTVMNMGGGIIVVSVSNRKDIDRIIFSVLVDAVICGFFYIKHYVAGKRICIIPYWKFALKFNIPLVPHYMSEIILSQSDRIMISKFMGYADAAKYTIAYSIVTLLQLVMNAISASFVPWSYEKLKAKRYEDIRKLSNTIMLLVCILTVGVMLFAPEIIMIFAGDKYEGAIYVVPPLAMSVFFIFLYEMFSTIEFYHQKTVGVMIASIIAALLNIVLNAVFIPLFGYWAAGYTTLVCYFMYSIAHYVLYKKVCKRELNGIQVFNVKLMIVSGLAMALITGIINVVYANSIIRYSLVVVILIIVILFRNKIITQLKLLKKTEEN